MPDAARLLLAGLVGAGIALMGQWWLLNNAAHKDTGSAVPLNSTETQSATGDMSSVALARALTELQSNQLALQDELIALRDQLARGSVGSGLESSEPAAEQPVNSEARPTNTAVTVGRLTAAGLAQDEADALIQRLDELALARLDTDYRIRQAAGDRELNKAVREERRQIPRDADAIRQEFGDAAYDSYLYAGGRPNRVEVASVLRSSAAERAGLQPGDVLRSLDGKPLFGVRDLTAQVRAGGPDQTYALSFERDGQTSEVWVPGGPLGVRVNGRSVAPD